MRKPIVAVVVLGALLSLSAQSPKKKRAISKPATAVISAKFKELATDTMDAVEVASSAKTEVGRDQANRQADLLLIKLRRMVNGDGNGDAEESAFASIVNYQIVSDRCEILRQAVSQEFFACLKQQAAAHDKAMKSIGLAN